MTGFGMSATRRPGRVHACTPPTAVAALRAGDTWECACERVRVVVDRDGRLVMVDLEVAGVVEYEDVEEVAG